MIDPETVKRAIHALFRYIEKTEKGDSTKLFDDFGKAIQVSVSRILHSFCAPNSDAYSTLKIQLKPGERHKQASKVMPTRVPIPNSLFSANEKEHSICIFCRSEDKLALTSVVSKDFFGIYNYIDHSNRTELFSFLAIDIFSVDDIRKKYHEYQDKKNLLNSYTHFLVDERVMQQIYNLIGPVCLPLIFY